MFALTDLFTGFAESAFPFLVVTDGFAKFLFPKVRPVGLAEIEFGIGALPQQIVAQTDFSAGAYQQVRIRHETGRHVRRDQIAVNRFGCQFAFCTEVAICRTASVISQREE